MIPKSKNSVALSLEKFASFCIITNSGHMLTTIKFNNQFLGQTDKIDYIWPNGMLTPEFASCQLPIPHPSLYQLFSFSQIFSKIPGQSRHRWFSSP